MESTPEPTTFGSILREKNFARLWYGQIISSLGDRFYQVALLFILGIKQGAYVGKDTARLTFCAMVPGLLLAPLYGWIVDRFSRRWVMLYADLARSVFTLTFLYLWFGIHSFVAVYAVIFIMGALNGLFIPARQAALPQIVGPAQLVTANALISLVGVIANFIGVPIASLVVSIFGAGSSFILNSVGFLISAWCIYHIQGDLPPTRSNDAQATEEVGTWRGALAGWRVLREQRELGALVLINSAFAFIGSMVLISLLQRVVVTVDLSMVRNVTDALGNVLRHFAPKPPTFDIKPLAFGLLMAAIGLGLGIGVGICGRAKLWSHSKALPYLALALLGLTLIGFAHVSSYLPIVAGAGFMGILSAFILIPIEARLQNDVDDARRGRLFALRNLCTTTSFLVGLAVNVNGKLLAYCGPAALIGYIGIGALTVSLILAIANAATLKSFWSARPQPAPQTPA